MGVLQGAPSPQVPARLVCLPGLQASLAGGRGLQSLPASSHGRFPRVCISLSGRWPPGLGQS